MTGKEGGKVLTFRWAGSPLIIPEVRQPRSDEPTRGRPCRCGKRRGCVCFKASESRALIVLPLWVTLQSIHVQLWSYLINVFMCAQRSILWPRMWAERLHRVNFDVFPWLYPLADSVAVWFGARGLESVWVSSSFALGTVGLTLVWNHSNAQPMAGIKLPPQRPAAQWQLRLSVAPRLRGRMLCFI